MYRLCEFKLLGQHGHVPTPQWFGNKSDGPLVSERVKYLDTNSSFLFNLRGTKIYSSRNKFEKQFLGSKKGETNGTFLSSAG